MSLRTDEPSDRWTFGQVNLRTDEPSDRWTFGQMNLRTNDMEPYNLRQKTFFKYIFIIGIYLHESFLVILHQVFFYSYFIIITIILYNYILPILCDMISRESNPKTFAWDTVCNSIISYLKKNVCCFIWIYSIDIIRFCGITIYVFVLNLIIYCNIFCHFASINLIHPTCVAPS